MGSIEVTPARRRLRSRTGRGPMLLRWAGCLVAVVAILTVPARAENPPSTAAAAVAPQRIMRQEPDAETQGWRAMLLAKQTEPGCFKAHYPDADWTAVACVEAAAASDAT